MIDEVIRENRSPQHVTHLPMCENLLLVQHWHRYKVLAKHISIILSMLIILRQQQLICMIHCLHCIIKYVSLNNLQVKTWYNCNLNMQYFLLHWLSLVMASALIMVYFLPRWISRISRDHENRTNAHVHSMISSCYLIQLKVSISELQYILSWVCEW